MIRAKTIRNAFVDVVIIALLIVCCLPVVHAEFKGYQLGDVDVSNSVDASDARIVLRRAAKLDELSYFYEKLADVNQDGNVDAVDARIILRWAAKLENLPEIYILNDRTTVSAVCDVNEVSVGDRFTVSVRVNNAEGLRTAVEWMTFDTSLVKLISTEVGDKIKASVVISEDPYEIKNANEEGLIHNATAYTRRLERENSVIIYTATFEAIASGTAEFGFLKKWDYYHLGNNAPYALNIESTASVEIKKKSESSDPSTGQDNSKYYFRTSGVTPIPDFGAFAGEKPDIDNWTNDYNWTNYTYYVSDYSIIEGYFHLLEQEGFVPVSQEDLDGSLMAAFSKGEDGDSFFGTLITRRGSVYQFMITIPEY